MGGKKYSIVVPAKNEQATIGDVLEQVKGMSDDVFVIDGYSTDNTCSIAKIHGIRVLFDNKLGKGDAVRVGLSNAKYPITVFIDADGSHDPEDISRLVEPIIQNKADLVIGSRMTGGSDELFGTISEAVRLFGSVIITLAINYRFNVRHTDYQNGFRAIRTDVGKAIKLKSNITTIEQEMGMKCLKYGYKIMEIPTHEYRRKGGVSKINVARVGHKYVWSLLTGIFTLKSSLKKEVI
jgi:dolichol-phosphate mannosyltransferase